MTVYVAVADLRAKVYLTMCAAYVILISYRQSTLEYSETLPRRFKGYTVFKDECRSKLRTGKEVEIKKVTYFNPLALELDI